MSEDRSTNSMSQSDVGVAQNEPENLPEEKPSPNHSVLESSATMDDLPSSNHSINEEPVIEKSLNEESFNEELVNETSFDNESVNDSPVTLTNNNKLSTLHMIGIPLSWERPDVEKFLKIHAKDDPEITENVTVMSFRKTKTNKRCFLTFTTPEIAMRANMLFKKKKVMYKGIKIFVVMLKTRSLTADYKRSRSRSPLGGMGIQSEIDKLRSLNKNERVLNMRNIPITWDKMKIEKYIRKHTSSNAMIGPNIKFIYMEHLFTKFTGVAMVRFANYEACKAARALLKKGYELYNGEKIWVDYEIMTQTSVVWSADDRPDFSLMRLLRKNAKPPEMQTAAVIKDHNNFKKQSYYNSYQSAGFQQKEQSHNAGNFNFVNSGPVKKKVRSKLFKNPPQSCENDLMQADHSPLDTYGLSIEFLNSQGIHPPLWSKIFVGNLDAQYEDETKIRKLFGHAGMVMSVAIIGKVGDSLKLKVEYDHPVEAVQAVCMFNNQEVYSKRLVVQMDKTPNAKKRFLPEGLKSFGPGLGLNGLPLKGVRSSVDLQFVKNTIMEEIAKVRQDLSQIHQGNNGSAAYSEKQPKQTSQSESRMNLPVNADPMAALTTALANSTQNNPLSALSSIFNPQALQMLQHLSQPNAGQHLDTVLQSAQGQSFNNQVVAASTPSWNLQSQATDVSQNMQTGNMNTQSGSNAAPMQSGTIMHGGLNMQSVQVMQDGSNMQGVASMQSGQVMQDGSNIQVVASMRGWSNVQDVASMQRGPAMQGGSNMQGVASMQSGPDMQGRSNMQGVASMQASPAVQGGTSIQSGLVKQGGASMQSRPIMQDGPNMKAGLNRPGGPSMQGLNMASRPNMQGGFNTQGGSNIQSGSKMHSGSSQSSNVSAAQNNNYGGGQPNNLRTSEPVYFDDSDRNRKFNDTSATVLFNYLPPSVTLPALHTKMQEVGDAKQVEMTGPGRAVVVFYSQRDAEACIQLLDQTRVDGQKIDVRFL